MFDQMCYAGGVLDRAAERRRDAGWLALRAADARSRVVPMWQDLNVLVDGTSPLRPLIVDGDAAPALMRAADVVALLGVDSDGLAWFAADLSPWPRDHVLALAEGASATDLRRVGALLDRGDAAILAHARGLLHWHRRHRFCGKCGGATEGLDGGHRRRCRDDACGAEHFPRLDPAVIMLVTRADDAGGACLLARQPRWPRGMYSTLAGFVEPGETLEEAVAREVREEVGVAVAGIRYRGSQPWPFPSSLMLGFRAQAVSGAEVAFDTEELEDARWFGRDDIRAFADQGRKLPRADSIAHWLIADWLAEDAG
jgi:NAD+ diphosphatase